MTKRNGATQPNSGLWHLVNALTRHVGGGVCKRVTLVAYFDAAGNCVGHEEIKVTKLYPKGVLDIIKGSNVTTGGDLD